MFKQGVWTIQMLIGCMHQMLLVSLYYVACHCSSTVAPICMLHMQLLRSGSSAEKPASTDDLHMLRGTASKTVPQELPARWIEESTLQHEQAGCTLQT